jgi:predicted membrane chloride channel (bestrophin family)
MRTERGRQVEYFARRGLFYSYVVLITPVIVLICIFGAFSMLRQFIDIWTTPLQLVAATVVGIRAIGHWIGIW